MIPLEYINKDLHTAPSLRRPVKKADLQRIKRDERIGNLKRSLQGRTTLGQGTANIVDYSSGTFTACVRETSEFVRRHPIQASIALLGGVLVLSLLTRHR